MPLEGTTTYGAWAPANPTSSCLLIAGDGIECILGSTALTIFVDHEFRIGNLRSNAITFEIDFAALDAIIATRQPLAGGARTLSRVVIPVQGTPYFLIGTTYNPAPDPKELVLVLFKIISPTVVDDVGSIALAAGTNTGPNEGGVCFGAGVLENDPGYVYVVFEGGYVSAGTAETWVARFPVSETDITNLTADALDLYATRLSTHGSSHPLSWGSLYGAGGEQTDSLGDKVTIVPDPNADVGLIRKIQLGDTPATYYAAVNIGVDLGDHGQLSEPAFTGSYIEDISTALGMPWADEGNHLDLSPSTDDHDGYTAPSHLGGGRVAFLRGDSNDHSQVFGRLFDINGADSIVSRGTFQFTHNSEVFATFIQAVQAYRIDGVRVIVGMRNDNQWILGETEIEEAPGDCPSSGFDLVYPPCVTAWTQCVKIQRRDGVSFRFTSLDQDVEFRGETYVTCGGLDPSATQVTAQTGEVGSSELAGLMVATGVKETELYGGLFDDAFVEIWLVPFDGAFDTADANIPRRLAAGWAGKVSHSTRGYKMEVLGPGARLDQRPVVQVYSPQCRWVFGDERCGVDIDALAVVGEVTSGLNRGTFLATLGSPITTGTGEAASTGELNAQFQNGRVRWLTGVNAGQVTEVKSVDFDTGQIILWALTCFVPEAGDTFDLLPGCAQDFTTCKNLYDNAINFGGFPHVPGRDAIMDSPDAKVG